MEIHLSGKFEEHLYGSFNIHLSRFEIDHFRFVILFSPIDTSDREYLSCRCKEVGFNVVDNCYDIKFDREDNFNNEMYYKPPSQGECSRRFLFQKELGVALKNIIESHCDIYKSRAYMAIAETDKLKRYYDRILQTESSDILLDIELDIGEGGKGYVLKTRYF